MSQQLSRKQREHLEYRLGRCCTLMVRTQNYIPAVPMHLNAHIACPHSVTVHIMLINWSANATESVSRVQAAASLGITARQLRNGLTLQDFERGCVPP